MRRTDPRIPLWTLEVSEISMGVYRAVATHEAGYAVSRTWHDEDRAVELCVIDCKEMDARTPASERKPGTPQAF